MFDSMFKSADILQKGLSAAWTRNAVIRHNIANFETPGFKAYDLEFESLLTKAIYEDNVRYNGTATHEWHIDKHGFTGAKTNPKHLDIGTGVSDPVSVEPRLVRQEDLSMRIDGNNVDIEGENVKLAQNSLYYNALMEKMNSELRRLRMAITEGR